MQELLSVWGLVLLKLLVATLCGGVVGYERERYDHPAGFRTHVLVCVGSAVYMMVSVAVSENGMYDPGRIAAQVASGIGFLGAGTIIKQGSIVRGLTTAASLWAVAGIGLAAGYNLTTLSIALLGTLVVLLTLYVLKTIETRIERRRTFTLTLKLDDPRSQLDWIRAAITAEGVEVTGLNFQDGIIGQSEVVLEGYAATRDKLERAVAAVSRHEAVQSVHWEYR
ncbi:MAG: MgtC/SapB family protein [Armatimonadota bacterium]